MSDTYLNRTIRRATPIGTFIREWREARAMSQEGLAVRLGVDTSFVSRIESGTRNFGPDQVPNVARVLNMDERDVALMIAGYDPALYRREIEQALWARLKAVIGPGAQEEAA